MSTELIGQYATDAGMLCIWDKLAFDGVEDYDSWEAQLCEDEDIRRHIKAGHFVPINTNQGVDGAFAVHLRVADASGSAELTDRERTYLLAESKPYLFVSSGRLWISSLEDVSGMPGPEIGSMEISVGRHAVKVCFLGWDEEPGMQDKKGRPKPGALPDFVVLLNPVGLKARRFRRKVHALDTPE